jgi:NAD(P)-dependent dehydrogenase (short-subunit alcohol dehydrogenase family)
VRLEPAELFNLDGKVAVVTGGGRGMGRSLVEGLAAAGADVVIASRKLENCERAAEEVRAATGRRALAVGFHVGKWDDCQRLIDTVDQHFGRVDILVNNAGMSPTYESLLGITEQLYDKTFDVNLKGPFRLAVLAAEYMKAAGGGSIINISSISSQRATTYALPYSCAKAGLNILTLGLAEAYAPTVRANAVLSGSFRTDASKSWDDDDSVVARRIPLGRIADPDEMVGTVTYLASDASTFTTGALIRVDGGRAAATI